MLFKKYKNLKRKLAYLQAMRIFDKVTIENLEEKLKQKEQLICPRIDRVIFSDPATIVFWKDNTKTVVKCLPNEVYDEEKGLALAYVKKIRGNGKGWHDIFERKCKGSCGIDKDRLMPIKRKYERKEK